MIWSDYKQLVYDTLTTVESSRRGLETFRDRVLRNSVLDLQRFIRPYRNGHTTVYVAGDLTILSQGMLGSLPAGAKPEAFYIQHVSSSDATQPDPNCARNRLDFTPWPHRRKLLCGQCMTNYGYAIDPGGTAFVIHPALNSETNLLLVWNGLKQDFNDADTVPWPSEASEASAAYILHRIALQVDKNPVLAQQQMKIYTDKRLALFRDAQETQDAEKPDGEYATTPFPMPDESIHSLDDLAAVLTANLILPVTKLWINAADGTEQYWYLANSVLPTSEGVQRPDDFNAISNPKVWFRTGT